MGEQRGLAPLLTVDLAPVTVELNLRESGARFPCKWSSVLEIYTRPHFAQVMVRHGYVSTNREAFDRYLDTDEYQKLERFKVSARDCIAAIRSDGGRAALAHPYQLGLDDERLEALIRQLKDSVLEAIECFYPRHTPEQTAFYLELARRYDLHVTGGSDKASTTNKRNCKEFVIQHKFNTKTALCNLP